VVAQLSTTIAGPLNVPFMTKEVSLFDLLDGFRTIFRYWNWLCVIHP